MLVCSICAFPMSVFVKGAFSPARRALTSTGWRKSFRESRFLVVAVVSVWAVADAASATRPMVKIFFMLFIFLRRHYPDQVLRVFSQPSDIGLTAPRRTWYKIRGFSTIL